MMGGSSKKVTVGYRYYLGMHLAICHGPVDAVTEIQVGERQAWGGNLAASGRITLNAPELFGGEKREGGVSGAVDIAFGEPTQAPNDYLVSKIGVPQPAYRGVLGLILRQLYIAANNPYIKPWAVRVKRCFRDWYPAKAEIAGAANPAHILYECLTNAAWGMGYPSASIDDASFRAAADTLATEGFGLNLIWLQQSKIEQFVREVLDHIGGVLSTSPSTGRFVLKLIRADYTVANLPVLDPTNVIDLESLQRAAWGETTNELVLVYTRPDTFKETSITVQDLANIQAQGAVVSQTRRYPGITSDALAARVALRDLAAVSTPLAKVRLSVNRRAWNLTPGEVFKLVWPALGIEGLVMRIAAIEGGTLTRGAIRIDAVE
ncbi:MAG: phage tail protein, partial [Parazoarcus communis]